jgi:hypothetical protein
LIKNAKKLCGAYAATAPLRAAMETVGYLVLQAKCAAQFAAGPECAYIFSIAAGLQQSAKGPPNTGIHLYCDVATGDLKTAYNVFYPFRNNALMKIAHEYVSGGICGDIRGEGLFKHAGTAKLGLFAARALNTESATDGMVSIESCKLIAPPGTKWGNDEDSKFMIALRRNHEEIAGNRTSIRDWLKRRDTDEKVYKVVPNLKIPQENHQIPE